MTLYSLYPPIALATVVNAFVLALAWRGYKEEIRAGEAPWWLILLLLFYIGGIFAYFHFAGTKQSPSGIFIFMASLSGEAFGVCVTFGILRALYFTRGMPKGEVIAAYVMAIGLSALLIWMTVAA